MISGPAGGCVPSWECWALGWLNFAGGQVRHQEEEESVCRNVQIEIDEAVNKKPEAGHEARELQGRSKRPSSSS